MILGLHPIDFSIILIYIIFVFSIGIYFSKRASKNMDEFFISGRNLPWWIVGTSMVATTFAADTPLVVSGLVAKGGIWKNWIWWNWGIGGMFAVFLFAKLWRRAGITTDAELVELRYEGKPAIVLRGYRALWFGLFQNLLIIAWVMKAMTKIILNVLNVDQNILIIGLKADVFIVLILFIITVVYTIMSGLWGVVATDVIQFVIAMGGSIYLAAVSYMKIGGMSIIRQKISQGGFDVQKVLNIIPKITPINQASPFTEFLLLAFVVWIIMYNVDGGGYLAQRLFAAKNEKHSMLAYLWYVVAFICLRPWPWIVVGLCGMAYFGNVSDPETYYPLMMKKMLPVGVFGAMIASFFAAFMSTIDTQLNWGASIFVNDVYKRFIRKKASQKEYVKAARLSILLLALIGGILSFTVKDISGAWVLVFSVTAGIGTVYILRWYWWRINAFSELTAFITSLIATFVMKYFAQIWPEIAAFKYPYSIILSTFLFVVPAWIIATFLTKPVSESHLMDFYKKVCPGGPGWKKIELKTGKTKKGLLTKNAFVNIILGVIIVNMFLLGTGKIILGSSLFGIVLLMLGLTLAFLFYKRIDKGE